MGGERAAGPWGGQSTLRERGEKVDRENKEGGSEFYVRSHVAALSASSRMSQRGRSV